jgi:glyoxylase-like metal-dependent hydrolase (beta-lactamase superfamily II)
VSFYFREEKTVIAGDTLFAGSIGRTDLYKGDFNQLSNSIKTELYSLPDETQVLSGHGPKTTIKREKLSNPYVNMR